MKFGIELEYTTNESCKYDYAHGLLRELGIKIEIYHM